MEERSTNPMLQIWQFFGVFFCFLTLLVGYAFTQGRASMLSADMYNEEEAFILRIEQLEAIDPQKTYRTYENFDAFMTYGTPNLIIRAFFESRGDCDVYDPFGEYSKDLLETQLISDVGREYVWDDPLMEIHGKTAAYISTPYTIKVEEVLLGDALKAGDTFTFWANYGIISTWKSFYIRYENYPIFQVGKEYVLFLSVVDVVGHDRWYSLINPAAALEIMIEDQRTLRTASGLAERQFDGTDYDYMTMQTRIQAIYQEHPYDLSILSMVPYGEKMEQ